MDFELTTDDLLANIFGDEDDELRAMMMAPRIDSRVSDSSTSSTTPSPLSSPLANRVEDATLTHATLDVFCKFTRELVRIRFPTDSNGWSYRVDIGGMSQHRWDYVGGLILVVKHGTCMKAIVPRRICRNCEMKDTWRRECVEPDDTFFLLRAVYEEEAVEQLRAVQIGEALEMGDYERQLYDNAQVCSFNLSPRKRYVNYDDKRRRMERLRDQVCIMLPDTLGLADELALRSNQEVMSMLSCEVSSNGALLPQSPIQVSSRVPPLPLPPLPSPLPSPLPPPLYSLLPVYDALIGTFLLQNGLVRRMDRSTLERLLKLITCQAPSTAVVQHDGFDRLFMQLGVPLSAQLFIKPFVIQWMNTILSTMTSSIASLRFGFYVAPSVTIFNSIKNLDVLPLFVTNAKHGLVDKYDVAIRTASQRIGVLPVLMVVPLSSAEGRLYRGAQMLALGTVGTGGKQL